MKSRSLLKLCLLFICAVFFALSAVIVSQNAYAYTNANLPKGENAIANIYDETTGKFSEENLTALAKRVKDESGNSIYEDIFDMVAAAEGGKTKNSNDFGETVVYFGKSNNGAGKDLAWIPAYLSRDMSGNAVLTLWLANTSNSNSDLDQQEVSSWSDGTYSSSASKIYNGSTIYSNSYDGSYIHNYVLNGRTDYTKDWGEGESITPPEASSMLKFTEFTTGALSSFIVTPDKVSWHINENKMRNDPAWNGSDSMGKGVNYPHAWTGDKVWLPSMYEVYDSSIAANSLAYVFSCDGGLWKTSSFKMTNSTSYWLRSGYPNYRDYSYLLDNYGSHTSVELYTRLGVRPALHLNLTMAKENAAPAHDHVWESENEDGWVVTTPATCTEDGVKTRVCTVEECPLENNTETEVITKFGHEWATEFTVDTPATCTTAGSKSKHCTRDSCDGKTEVTEIPATGHKFADGWSSDENNHWHAATCGHEVKDDEAAHEWDSGKITKEATCSAEGVRTYTCSVCKRTKTEAIEKIAHTEVVDEAVEATCTTAGKTAGKHCSVCKEVLEEQKAVPALEHDYKAAEGGKAPTCTEDGFGKVICSRCGDEKEGDVIPALGHKHEAIAGKAATCTEAGLTDGDKCPVCGTILTEQQEIKALGHDFGAWVETKPATYTEDGEEKRECQRSGCTHFETRVIPMKVKVAITVTINPASSEVGATLETLTATVTSGTLIDPADMPYTLSTNADKDVLGTYTITGVCTDERYNITFIDGVYIVSKKADDPNGGGEIDLPVDINVEFKVTQSSTDNDYSDLEGLKRGYWAQLWYRNEDGTLGDEFTDKMNCFLTLKIPTEIIEAIRGGEEINRDKIAEGLTVYYYVDGQRYDVDNFAIAQRDDESWQIKFNYNAKFRAEVVFNAANFSENNEPAAGIPWWVWLIVGLAGAAVVGVVIVIIVVAKKKNSAAVVADNGEVLGRLDKQDEKLNEIREIVDGGFNDIVDD